jgi:hypothetical protein
VKPLFACSGEAAKTLRMVGLEGVEPSVTSDGPREPTRVSRILALLRRHASKLVAVAVVGLGTWAVVLHAQAYGYFMTDDAFISLRYSERLLEGKGLTWNDFERVEGYSDLLWVLLCAVPGLFGAGLVSGARALGALCTAATLGAVVAAVRPTRPIQWLGAALALGMFVASDSIAVWSMGGLESPLVGALLSWGIVTALASARGGGRAATIGAGVCFGLICWARIDAPLWPAAAIVGLLLGYRKRALRTCLAIGVGAATCIALQLVFRLAYYHDYLPNTAYAKVALTDDRLQSGLEHLKSSLLPLGASWLALVSCGLHGLRHPRLRPMAILHLVLASAWTVYLVRVGGDIFPAWRLLTYVVVVAGMLVAFVLGDDLRSPIAPAALRWTTTLVALAAVGSYFNPQNWAKVEVWQWHGQVVGKTLARMFGDARPLVAVDAAGTIPYYSKLPALDMLGLTDQYLAHHRPKNMGSGFMGHELGDASYFLQRAPDIICFGVPPCQQPGKFPAQVQMVARREFQRGYAPLHFETTNGNQTLTAILWVRREGRIGIRTAQNSVFVPSYFLTTAEGAMARQKSPGTIEASLPSGARARVERLTLAPGHWRFEALAAAGSARVMLSTRGRSLASGDAATALDFTLAEPTPVDIDLTVNGGSYFTTTGLKLDAGS